MTINRTTLVNQVATAAELKKTEAQRAVDAVFEAIAMGLCQRTEVKIPGFGIFRVTHRAAREGRNMATGEPVKIAARDTAKFVPGKVLKEMLNPPPSVPRRRSA